MVVIPHAKSAENAEIIIITLMAGLGLKLSTIVINRIRASKQTYETHAYNNVLRIEYICIQCLVQYD